MTLENQIKDIADKLSKVSKLDGYFEIDYYTGDITVLGVYLPEGLCRCRRLNRSRNDFEYEEYEWKDFSEYTQRMILLEVADATKT